MVVGPQVDRVNVSKPLPDTDVRRVPSVTGVAWAVPLFVNVQSAKLSDGNFKPVLLVSLDNATLV